MTDEGESPLEGRWGQYDQLRPLGPRVPVGAGPDWNEYRMLF
ncbi:hypothetical protein [Streptomyces glaucus]